MTEAEMIDLVADKSRCAPSHARAAVHALFDEIAARVSRGERVRLPGIGTLSRARTAPRKAMNLHTGAAIDVPAGYRVKLTQAKAMKQRLAAVAPEAQQQAAE